MRKTTVFAVVVATALAAVLGIGGAAPGGPVSAAEVTPAIGSDFTNDTNVGPIFEPEPDYEGPPGENQNAGNKPPVFVLNNIRFHTVLENYGPLITAGGYQVSDPENDQMTLSLAGADAARFSISQSLSGNVLFAFLELSATPDYESPDDANGDGVYEVTVQATDADGSSETTKLDVTVTVLDVDEAPVITGSAEVNSPENSAADVGQYSAADPEGEDATLTLGGTDAASFTFADGTLTFNAAPDYETKDSYSVTFTASDGRNTSTRDVTITITDVDETRAIILIGSGEFSIAENSSMLSLATYTATDPDGGQITWSLEGVDQDYFSISSGVLSLNASPDYEVKTSYLVTVQAATGSKNTPRNVTVAVINDPNEPPVITGPSEVSLLEHTTVKVGQYTASDQEGETPTLILGGTDAASFTFSDGTLTFKAAPDYETKHSYSVTFTASDGTNTTTLEVTVTIINLGEVGRLRVTSEYQSLQVSVDWDDDAVADEYRVRWRLHGPGNHLNKGVSATTSDATVTVRDYGKWVVRVEACNESGCGPAVARTVTVDGGQFCNRTPVVRNAIMDKGPYVADCTRFTTEHLAGITGNLDLEDYGLKALKAGDFDGLTGLDGRLALNHNILAELPEDLFDDLTSLTVLWLEYNRLTELREDEFSALTKLKVLDLAGNRLTALPGGLIDENSKLQHLYLQKNKLTSIPTELLDERSKLITLLLNGNRLTPLPAGLFADLTSITTLERDDPVNPRLCDRPEAERDDILEELPNISNCKLVTHADVTQALAARSAPTVCNRTPAVRDAIVSMVDDVTACADVTNAHLAEITGPLNLAKKEIATLKIGDLDGLSGLTAVDLQNNSLQSLPISLFKDLSALTSVKLNDNDLSWVPARLFRGLTGLQKIFLNDNELARIDPGAFDSLTSLQTLHLDDNELSHLPPGLFVDLTGIQTLQLDSGVDPGLCTRPQAFQDAYLNRHPDFSDCKLMHYWDLRLPARKYIEETHIVPAQKRYPWLHEAWFDVPVTISVGPGNRAAYFYYLSPPDVFFGFPWPYQAASVSYHELAHHYTISPRIHADDPTAKLSMLSAWLYESDRKRRTGQPENITESLASRLATVVLRGEAARSQNEEIRTVMESVSSQEIPQWFFDTYATDGTLETVAHDKLWSDFKHARRSDGYFAWSAWLQLSTLFGGYCSLPEGKWALTHDGARNPWVDGGCVNRRPQELSVTAGGAGELSVSWSAPLWTDGPAIDAYVVQWKSGDQEYDTTREELVDTLNNLSHTITGLTTGAEYTVRVAAVNKLGTTDFVDNHGHVRTTEATANAG